MEDFIENLARRAGDVLLSHFGKDGELLTLRMSFKEAVTRYDKMVDELIVRGIRDRYPHYSLLTEESGLLKGDTDWLWVAAGKGEAYFTTKIEPWDVAPGVLLVREAGGEVTDFEGNEWKLEKSDLLFSNGKVHPSVLDLLRQDTAGDSRGD